MTSLNCFHNFVLRRSNQLLDPKNEGRCYIRVFIKCRKCGEVKPLRTYHVTKRVEVGGLILAVG